MFPQLRRSIVSDSFAAPLPTNVHHVHPLDGVGDEDKCFVEFFEFLALMLRNSWKSEYRFNYRPNDNISLWTRMYGTFALTNQWNAVSGNCELGLKEKNIQENLHVSILKEFTISATLWSEKY